MPILQLTFLILEDKPFYKTLMEVLNMTETDLLLAQSNHF